MGDRGDAVPTLRLLNGTRCVDAACCENKHLVSLPKPSLWISIRLHCNWKRFICVKNVRGVRARKLRWPLGKLGCLPPAWEADTHAVQSFPFPNGTWYVDVVCCLNITFVTWLKPSLLKAYEFLCLWKSSICVYACQGCRKYTHIHMLICVCMCESVWKLCVCTTGMWDKQQFRTTPSTLQWKAKHVDVVRCEEQICLMAESIPLGLIDLFVCTWKSVIWVYEHRVVGSSDCATTEDICFCLPSEWQQTECSTKPSTLLCQENILMLFVVRTTPLLHNQSAPPPPPRSCILFRNWTYVIWVSKLSGVGKCYFVCDPFRRQTT